MAPTEPLLAAAGLIDLRATRALLAQLLEPGGDVSGEWLISGMDAAEARAAALDEETPAAEIRALAGRVFGTCRAHGEALETGGLARVGDPELQAVLAAWPRLAAARRAKVAEYAREQADLSDTMRPWIPATSTSARCSSG